MSYEDLDRWGDEHGYVHMRCKRCGWSGYTDGAGPECGCYDEPDEEKGLRCCDCGEVEDDCCCGDGFMRQGKSVTCTHVARRDHKDGKVKKGDTYKVTRTHYWRAGGPSQWGHSKKVIKKGA